jgi:acetyltransferase-like isoleucine patch superfamily enzyme
MVMAVVTVMEQSLPRKRNPSKQEILMRILINSLRLIWNDIKIWGKLKFLYPYKPNYKRVKSFVPLHLKLQQGTILESNIYLSPHLKAIGKHVYIANNTYIGFCEKIGNFTSISFGVKIGLINHPINYVSTSPVFYAKRRGWVSENKFDESGKGMVEIGNDVLISANVIILSGVIIGDGAVIGAGAVVTQNVEPYSIIGGVPAKLIKYRFNEETRNSLKQSRWWEKSDDELKEMVESFNDPELFLNHLNKRTD